jgi:hypothetical protein
MTVVFFVVGAALAVPGIAVVAEAVLYRIVFQNLFDEETMEHYDRMSGTRRRLRAWIWEATLVGVFLFCQGLYLTEQWRIELCHG